MRFSRWTTRLTLLLIGVLAPLSVSAVNILPACASGTGFGDCNTCDVFALAANLAEFMLQFLGGAVLLMVVIGGIVWIVSAGNPNLVQKGQAILVGAAIGTLLVLGGYFIVNSVVAGFVGDTDFQDVQLFDTNWATYCEDQNNSAVVGDCTDRPDGKRCTSDSCLDDNTCQCLNEVCVTACEVQWSLAGGENDTAACVADAGACSGTDGGPGLCPEAAPYCCLQQSSIGDEGAAEIEADIAECNGKLAGEDCTSASCTVEGGCVCDSDNGNCVPLCNYSYNTETSTGTCTSEESCSSLSGSNEGEGESFGCVEGQICCSIPS